MNAPVCDIRPVRCNLGFIRFDRWLAGFPVPSFAEFKAAGFAYNNLHIDWLNIDPANRALNELVRVRLYNLQTFSFALPSSDALRAITALSPILEVGAGTGAWSMLLQMVGADVIATDACGHSNTRYVQQAMAGHYFPIEGRRAEEAVLRHPHRNVLAVWPCLGDPWMFYAAHAMQPGTRLALVHAGRRGCIAEPKLFDLLDSRFVLESEMAIPRWPGMQDRLGIWKKA